MKNRNIEHDNWWSPINKLLYVNTLLCVVLLIIRITVSHTDMYLFLIWNIFLAAIPWVISSIVLKYPVLIKKKFLLFFSGFIWLLFFPNAPYILTDLFHLKRPSPMPLWFDLSLVLSAAWSGLMFGFVSIQHADRILSQYFNRKLRGFIITIIFFISGFGIYLGRYLRWNSWDIVHQPSTFFYDIGSMFLNPINNLDIWAMTIIFGSILSLFYWSVRLFSTQIHNLNKI